MSAKLQTTIENLEKKVVNQENSQIIHVFYRYLKSKDTSENFQNGILKVIIGYVDLLGPSFYLTKIQSKEDILKFLDLKGKNEGKERDKKQITIGMTTFGD